MFDFAITHKKVEVAEWSKAVDSGSIPKGRGFKSRPQHFLLFLSHLYSPFCLPTSLRSIPLPIKYHQLTSSSYQYQYNYH